MKGDKKLQNPLYNLVQASFLCPLNIHFENNISYFGFQRDNVHAQIMCRCTHQVDNVYLTSQQYCGVPGTLRFRCQWGGNAALVAPGSHPVSPPRTEHHADLSTDKQAT